MLHLLPKESDSWGARGPCESAFLTSCLNHFNSHKSLRTAAPNFAIGSRPGILGILVPGNEMRVASPYTVDLAQRAYVSQLSMTVTNTSERGITKRKGLFWLMDSEVSVCGQLAPLFWKLFNASENTWQRQLCISCWPESRKRERKKSGTKDTLQRYIPSK